MLCGISSCICFRWHNFCKDTIYVHNLLHVSAFLRSSGVHIRCWLHSCPLTLANVYSVYILCCRFDILGCNAAIYVLVERLNLKIVKLLKFVEF
jgi:hypothetical protein